MHYLEECDNIPQAFFRMASEHPELVVYEQAIIDPANDAPDKPRQWNGRNYKEVEERVRKIADYLQSLGAGKNSKIAIVSQSRPEWIEADLAILAIGGVTISVYQTLPVDDVGYILFDSDTEVVFAENEEQVEKIKTLLSRKIDIPATEDREFQEAIIQLKKVICFEQVNTDEVFVQFEDIFRRDVPASLPSAVSELSREDLASLVYTSGTTGPPKGVVQTHGNHLANCRQAVSARILQDRWSILVFLPLAHSFAKLMGFLGTLTTASLKFPAVPDTRSSRLDPASVTKDIREARANIIPIVPRLLEKMQAGLKARAAGSGLSAKLVGWTIQYAEKIYIAEEQGRSGSIFEQVAHGGLSPLRQKIKHQLFGDQFHYCVSGGAKLNTDVARFFDMLGIEILEGYGLTETCVATNINRQGNKKIGSVGPVLDTDIEMHLAEDGEILFRGPNVAKGYYNRPTATRASWDDENWFHTGDLGEVDEDGFLKIVGRKKDIIVTSYGKNIAPDAVEGVLKSSPYISQAVLVGDARAFCVALVTIDEAAVRSWAKKQGHTLNGTAADDSRVKDLIEGEVKNLSASLAHHEAPKKIEILPEDLTVENGFLTPTFKVKKKQVMEEFKDQIESLYAGS